MKKIVSIALFGDGNKYARGLPAFVRAHLNLFPLAEGWKLRIHIDEAIAASKYGVFIESLAVRGLVERRQMGTAPLCAAMLWRMAPVFDNDVSHTFCRDLDAAPMPRDRAVCEQFISSKTTIGTCHDNRAHGGIMGGLSHYWNHEFRNVTGWKSLEDLYAAAKFTDEQWSHHGADQVALNGLLSTDPRVKMLEHRFNGWTEGKPSDFRRAAGSYQCDAYSMPTPDVGYAPRLSNELREKADRLANHLGAAGYDFDAAVRFWDQHGDRDLSALIAGCEGGL